MVREETEEDKGREYQSTMRTERAEGRRKMTQPETVTQDRGEGAVAGEEGMEGHIRL